MNGKEVYKFATREVPKVLEESMEAAGITVDDVDWLLLHQANIRIMEVVAKRLGIPMEKVITNLASYGNTSAGSIPLALDEAVRSGKVKKGDVIACAGVSSVFRSHTKNAIALTLLFDFLNTRTVWSGSVLGVRHFQVGVVAYFATAKPYISPLHLCQLSILTEFSLIDLKSLRVADA